MNNEDQIKKLTAQNAVLENYFSNTIIPQLFIDADLKLRKFTPPAMKQFNLSPNDLGKSIYDIEDHFRFHSLIDNINQVMDSAEILEKEIQTTDFRWYQMNILPYVNHVDNKTNGVIVTFVDITYRIKDLKEQEKLILDHESLLDTISHDINNPLSGLLLTIELLNDGGVEDGELISLLKIVEHGVKKIHHVITELTDIRKHEHAYRGIHELLNFENIIEDVRFILLDKIKESGTVIKCELNISEIHFSRRKLRSIIYNLLNNAIKFKSADRKPEIFIKTFKERNYIILSIKDNSIGIEESKHEEIFSKYFKVDNAFEGAGVGLHLVKELVINTGGKILIESQIGVGTEFKIYLRTQ